MVAWDEHGASHARVEKVEPPHLFSFRWARAAGSEPTEGNSTLVELSLSAEGEGTHLLRHVLAELDGSDDEKAKYAEENTQGWRVELDELREYVSKQVRATAGR